MWKSAKQEWDELKEELSEYKKLIGTEEDRLKWWKSLDMNDPFLINLYSKMYGSNDQIICQLYIIRNNLNLKKKKDEKEKKL